MDFNVSFDAGSADLGSLTTARQQTLLAVVNAAANIWAGYLTAANITLNLSVVVDNALFSGNVLAEGGPDSFVDTGTTSGGKTVYEAGTTYELQTGVDPNGTTADLSIYLTTNSILNLLYFKTDPYAAVPSGRYDALSVFLHEIGHGLGIIDVGEDSFFPGTSLFDTLVQNGAFTGANAEAAYQQLLGISGALPLEPGSPSHLAESGPLGLDVMSPVLDGGTNVGVSAIDLGILEDIGDPVRRPTSENDAIHAVPGIVLHLGAGNDIGYAAGSGSTIYGDDGNDQLAGDRINDRLYGGDGNDTLTGNGGDDYLDGGAGTDTAYFNAPASNYRVIQLSPTNAIVTDLRFGAPDGTDTLVDIEKVVWGDGSVTILNAPPVVMTANVTLWKGQTVSLSSLFTVSDPSGYAITKYQLWDSNRDSDSGHFVVGGVAQPAGTVITISASQLSSTTFVAGNVGDQLQIRAFDGHNWSADDNAAWAPFNVTAITPPPQVTTANVTENARQTIAVSSLFSVTDPLGLAITRYQFLDTTSDSDSGHFTLNGVAQAAGTVIDVAATDLGQVSFVTGNFSAADDLQVRAYDGESWSAADTVAWAPFRISVYPDRPVVTASNVTEPANTLVPLASLFSVSDPGGLPITMYDIYDGQTYSSSDPTIGSGLPYAGNILVNGVPQRAFTDIYLTPDQLAQTTLLVGTARANLLNIRAFNGQNWSSDSVSTATSFRVDPSGTLNNRTELTLGTVQPNNSGINPIGSFAAQRNQTLAPSAFAFTFDADHDAITDYQVIDNTSDSQSGHWVVNGVAQAAGSVIDLTPAQWAQTSFVTGRIGDDIQMRVFDGKNWSASSFGTHYQWIPADIAWADLKISVPNVAPVVTTANVIRLRAQTMALSSLFSVSDGDGDAITKYEIRDSTPAAASGYFIVNGAAQAAGTVIDISASDLAQTSFITGNVADRLEIRGFDGQSWSTADNAAWSPFTVSVIDSAPVITTSNVTRSHAQTLALSSLFSASDRDGDTITAYQLWDSGRNPSSGHFVISGIAQAAGTVIDITAAQLAQTSFVTGTVGDQLQIRAFDGDLWSAADNAAWSPFTVSVTNAAPVLATADLAAQHHQTLALSSLFSASDTDGDSMTGYQLWDSGRDPASGHFVVDGAAQAAGTVIDISLAQLAQTWFVTGTLGDQLQIRAFDGQAWSAADDVAWSPFTVSMTNAAPVLTTANLTAQHVQTLALSSLFSIGDADGDTMTRYQLWDSTRDPNSGHFVVNGVAQAAGTVIDISAAQLTQTSFVTGAVGDQLQIRAFDGQAWSADENAAWSPFMVSVPAYTAPVVTTADISTTPNQTLALSSLFSVSDADGDAMTEYQLWDSSRDPSSGHFVVNGVAQAAGTVIDIPSGQLTQTSFVTGTMGDSLQVRAFDGRSWSAADSAAWSPFHIAT